MKAVDRVNSIKASKALEVVKRVGKKRSRGESTPVDAPMIRINCDLGESFGPWTMGLDADVMPHIDSANIACGFHGGDASVMRRSILLAKQHNVEIGAHVSYPDLQGFGRRSMAIRGQELIDMLHYQIAALDGMARTHGTKIGYVKPHGAMYNDMMKDTELLADIMQAVASWHKTVDLVVMATPKDRQAVQLGIDYGVSLRFEAFADRGYTNAGYLIARDKPGALLDEEGAVAQALAIARGELSSSRGKSLHLKPDTLCVHGDTPAAVAMVKAIREAMTQPED